jgi:hypothetical protein
MLNRQVLRHIDRFDRAQTITTTPSGDFGWTLTKTAAAGSPTMACVNGGALNITLAANNEAENMCLSQNDILPYLWDHVQHVWFVARAPVAFVSGDTCFFGIGNGRNDAVALITQKAVFKLVAATSLTAVVIDSKDGTTALSNIATGATLTSTFKKFQLDFTQGLKDVRFFIDGARVALSQAFDLSALAGSNNFQLMAQLQKTATTNVPQLELAEVGIQFVTNQGA